LLPLAARGGESSAEGQPISDKMAVVQLDLLLQHLFKPKPGDKTPLMTWVLDKREHESNETVRYSVTIAPLNRTFTSRWLDSGVKAKREAAQKALGRRLGDNSLGDVRATLSQILRNALDGKDFSTETTQVQGGFQSSLQFPEDLFAPESPPERKTFEGQGKSKQEAIRSAARAALCFVCVSIAVFPALKALSDGAKKAKGGLGRGSSTVILGNFNAAASEEAIRTQLEQFGKVTDLELKRGKSQCRGSATYEHRLSAWTASRILDRSPVDDRIVFVKQRAEVAKVPGRRPTMKTWGVATSPDTVLFYSNAPYTESWTSMLDRFKKVGDVKAFRYWVDPETQKSRGRGTLGFASVAAAKEALEKLHGMQIGDRQLQVEFYKKHEKQATETVAAASEVAIAA